jgi:exonuclease V gamma subunit
LPLQSYNQYWCDIANQLTQSKPAKLRLNWSQQPLVPVSEDVPLSNLDLLQLCRFLRHPVEYFFRQRLKIYL